MRNRSEAVAVALQIAFEYPGFGDEHVSAMMDTYEDEKPPFSFDELMDLTVIAAKHKQEGRTFNEAEKLMMKRERR